jgi:hypothetical protein
MSPWPWAITLALVALVLLYGITSRLAKLLDEVNRLRGQLEFMMSPGVNGSGPSHLYQINEQLQNISAVVERIRDHQENGPQNPSQPP